jgi:hypothetical protein
MKAEHFIENNYHSKVGLEADKLIEDKTGKEVSFEEIAEAYHEHKLKLLGIANVVDNKPELKAALNYAVSAIYFNDNSDYLSGLYGTVRSLTGLEELTDEDITNLFKKINPE